MNILNHAILFNVCECRLFTNLNRNILDFSALGGILCITLRLIIYSTEFSQFTMYISTILKQCLTLVQVENYDCLH